MLEKSNFSVWDILVHMLTGLSFIIFFTFLFPYSISDFLIKNKKEVESISTALTLTLPLILIWIGMIIEPIANIAYEKSQKIFFLKYKEARNTENVIKKINEIKNGSIDSKLLFRYCNAFAEQKIPTNNIQIYLARFGFYRNTSFISVVIATAIWTTDYTSLEKLFYTVGFAAFSLVFLLRANRFKQIQEYEVFFSYLAYITKEEDHKNA